MANKIAVQTGGPEEILGVDETYRKIREWGFDAVDANIDHLLSCQDIENGIVPDILVNGGKDCMELFKPWAEAAKKYGIENYQAHAPFRTWLPKYGDEVNQRLIEELKNMIRGCDVMQCRNLIIHPAFPFYSERTPSDDAWELNISRYMQLAPVAKEYGVTINLENMFIVNRGKAYASVCNNPDMAAKYVDTLNSLAGENVFGFCLDTGHALLAGLDVKDFMKTMGKRITAFHIHDNNGIQDQHLAPYMGVLDWKSFNEGLTAIDYQSTLSFETFNVWRVVNPCVIEEMMKYIAAFGRALAERKVK